MVETSAADVLRAMSLRSIVAALPMRLRAELTWYVEMSLALDVAGAEPGQFTVHLRRGVLEVREGPAQQADASIWFADQAALVDYLGGADRAALESESRVKVEGDRDAATRFTSYLDEPPNASRILVTRHGPAR